MAPVSLGTNNEPRRELRQGNEKEDVRSPRPGNGVARGLRRRDVTIDETTLGNGYLGSRIDEERSEMRYLV